MARHRVPRALAGSLLILCLLATFALPADPRELAVDPDELVPVELATVGVDRGSGAPLVLLREPTSGDMVPILIGMTEARAILFAMHGVVPPRPLTHDLMDELLSAADVTLRRVIVDDLQDSTFLGMIELEGSEPDEPIRVDARPSDALALAARTGAAIHVAPRILEEAGQHFEFESPESDQAVTALGITVVELTPDLREALELPDRPGVLVSRAEGEAADAGLAEGAVILSVNGEAPDSPMAFLDLVRETPEDEDVELVYWLDGEEHEISLPPDVPTVPQGEGRRIRL